MTDVRAGRPGVSRPAETEGGHDPTKRPRFIAPMQTPGATSMLPSASGLHTTPGSVARTPAQGPGGGDILDYLKGRGGRIKELEEELLRQRSTNEQLSVTVRQAQETISRLELQLAVSLNGTGQQGHVQEDKQTGVANQERSRRRSNAGRSPPAVVTSALSSAAASANIGQLEALLDEQLSRNLKLEEQLARIKNRVAEAEARLASTTEAAVATQAESKQSASAATLQAESLRKEIAAVRAEGAEALAAAQLTAKLEARRLQGEQELHRATQAALVAVQARVAEQEAELKDLRNQLAQAQGAAAGLASALSPRSQGTGVSTQGQLLVAAVTAAAASANAGATAPSPAVVVALQSRVAELQAQVATLQTQLQQQQQGHDQRRAGALSTLAMAAGAGAENLPSAVSELHAERAAAAAELQAWRAILPLALPPGSAASAAAATQDPTAQARAAVAALTRAMTELKEAKTSLQAREVALLEVQVLSEGAAAREAALAAEAAQAKSELQSALTEAAIANKKLAVVMQERDALSKVLSEPLPSSDGPPNSIGARLAAAQAASRAAQAEARLIDLTHAHGKAQEELERLQRSEAAARAEAEAATTRATAAEARVASLEREADGLARDVATLQEKLGRGEFSRSSSVRVLHLRMNPESELHKQAQEGEVGALKAEVEALRGSLASMESALKAAQQQLAQAEAAAAATAGQQAPATAPAVRAASAGSDPPPSAALAAKEAEIAVLRHKVAEAEKAAARLREVFKERAAAFREAVTALFGYRVEMTSEATAAKNAGSAPSTFSLRPLHADHPDDLLVFRHTRERGMELVPTPFTTQKLAREVETFVGRFRSIPALTANLTMELFQRQTQA